jgi:hypothetical protein
VGQVRYQLVHKDGQDHVIEIHTVVFKIGDVVPTTFGPLGSSKTYEIIREWKATPQGKFIMEHFIKGSFEQTAVYSFESDQYRVGVKVEIEGKNLTKYYLMYGD